MYVYLVVHKDTAEHTTYVYFPYLKGYYAN